jgi:ABC-type lipoprotein export system ATPase subunit
MSATLRGARADGEADEVLETLGLRARADHRPAQMSGGEQQRLALACAVVGGPSVVLADEPTAELDSESARDLMEMVAVLRDRGQSFVIATHDPIAMKVADVTVHLRHGAMEAETLEDRSCP